MKRSAKIFFIFHYFLVYTKKCVNNDENVFFYYVTRVTHDLLLTISCVHFTICGSKTYYVAFIMALLVFIQISIKQLNTH